MMHDTAFICSPCAARARLVLRLINGHAALSAAFGCTLPLKIGQSSIKDQRGALCLGPDEWLLLSGGETGADIVAMLSMHLMPEAGSLVDVSHRQLGFVLEGPGAMLALSSFVPLDLDLRAFPIGMVTRTLFEKAEIILWRRGETRFEIEIWRSFAPYLTTLLDIVRKENAAIVQ